jgi:MAC/Perforin domain
MARNSFRRIIPLAIMFSAFPVFAQDEQYQSFEISEPDALVLAPDQRLEFGPEGTVEMWISASQSQPSANSGPAAKEVCILQSGDQDSGINFRVSIQPNGAGIAIYRGDIAKGAASSFPILGQGDIHIAFVTAGTGTVLIVNGTAGGSNRLGVPTSISTFQYLPPSPTGRSLHLGCDGSLPTAHVWLRTLRFWDRALAQDELNWAGTFSGFPDGRPEVTRHLVAYSAFTDQRTEVRFTGPQIQFTSLVGSGENTFFLRRPPTQELAAIYVPPSSTAGPDGFRDLKLEFDDASRPLALTGDNTKPHTMPTVVSLKPTQVNWIGAAFLRDLLEPLEARRDNPQGLALYQQPFSDARIAARNALLGFSDDQNGVAFPDRMSTLRFDIEGGARFRRMTGVRNGQYITTLRFDSTETTGNFRGGNALIQSNIAKGTEIFSLVLPPGAQFEGLAGRTTKGQLSSLALAYSYPNSAGGGAPALDTVPLWIDRDEKPPTRDEDTTPAAKGGPALLHGDYSSQRGYRIQTNPLGDELTITVVEPSNKKVAAQSFVFRHAAGGIWNAWNQPQRPGNLIIQGAQIHWIGADSVYERTLIPAPAYEESSADKLPWGATFSLEQRPPLVEASFKGYFPYLMHARDFQATTGVDRNVFAMPADGSQAYTTTGSHVIVPYGLYFRLDNKGFEQEDTFIYRTADERQFGWNVNLGVNVGIPLIFSFSEDVDYQTSQEQMATSQSSSTLTRSIATHYALVMDLARMKLDSDFEERIFEMRDRLLMGFTLDWKSLFLSFGTHYPYAVTYGGMAWLESYTDKMDVNTKDTESMKLSAEAKASFDIEVGGKIGGGYNKSSSHGGGTESTVTMFGTGGGSFSRGGGWSLSRGEEVPVLLDLRPIHELLSPAFFTDPLIWTDLRKDAVKAYDDFVRALAMQTFKDHHWESVRLDPKGWGSEN